MIARNKKQYVEIEKIDIGSIVLMLIGYPFILVYSLTKIMFEIIISFIPIINFIYIYKNSDLISMNRFSLDSVKYKQIVEVKQYDSEK